jgi:hypothetical protein
LKFKSALVTTNGSIKTFEFSLEDMKQLEEEIFQIAKQVKNTDMCIVVNKPQYLCLKDYRSIYQVIVNRGGTTPPLTMFGHKILPGWCSKPVVVEID